MKTSAISKLAKLIPALALSLVLGLILTTGLGGRVSAASVNLMEAPINPQPFYDGANLSAFPITVGNSIPPGGDYMGLWNFDTSSVCSTATINKVVVSITASNVVQIDGIDSQRWFTGLLNTANQTSTPLTILNNSAYFSSDIGNLAAVRGQEWDGDPNFLPAYTSSGTITFSADLPNVPVNQFATDYALFVYFHHDEITFSKNFITAEYDPGAGADCNQPPTPSTDTSSTTPSTPVTINPLTNDSDPDNDTLTITNAVVSSGDTNGTVKINDDGTITYTPSPGFMGTTTITYTVDDGNGGTTTSTITITVSEDSTVTTTTNSQPGSGRAGSSNLIEDGKPILAKTGQNQVAILSLVTLGLVGIIALKRKARV